MSDLQEGAIPGVPDPGSVGKGLGIGFGLTIAGGILGLVLLAVYIGMVILLGIGLVQLCWIIPVSLSYKKRRETETVKGILIAAGITFLLNAGCWGMAGVVMRGPMH